MTPEKILGLPELIRAEYSDLELKAIKLALFELANSRNENFEKEKVNSWLHTFSELRLTPLNIIKRIRLAKLLKKYGEADFSIFMECNVDNYAETFKHKSINENYVDPEIEKINKEMELGPNI